MGHRKMISVRYVTQISIFLAKPIALIGSAVVVYYKFGIMELLFTPVNVPYADVKSPCWFPVKHHQGNATWSILRRSCRELKDITVYMVNGQMVSCRECKTYHFFSGDCYEILEIHKEHFHLLSGHVFTWQWLLVLYMSLAQWTLFLKDC